MKKSTAVRAQSIGLRPCFVRGLRRSAKVCLRYTLAFIAAGALSIVVIPAVSRALYAAGVTKTFVSDVSFNLDDNETWTRALPIMFAIFAYYGIIGAILHLAFVTGFLAILMRGRRRFTRYVMRCSAHRGGWLAPAAVALLLPTEMLGFWMLLPLLWVCAIVIGAIIFLRRCYWGRARRITRMCVHCRYILRGLPDVGRCPECGTRYGFMVDQQSAADSE